MTLLTNKLRDRNLSLKAIRIGLDELFNGDKDAVVQWLISPRSEFAGDSALDHIFKGDQQNVRDVVDLVDEARGLR